MADNNTFWISDADKEWVHDCFSWLLQAYGYPDRTGKTILFTEEFFPATFSNKQIDVESIVNDLCVLLSIPEDKLTYEIVEDIRDTQGMPYEIHGPAFECEMDINETVEGNNYHIFLAKTLLKHPGRLLLNLIIETIKAKQIENNISFENDKGADLFMYNVGIYWGYGILLYQNLVEQGKSSDGLFWESKWNFASPMPTPLMAYALALYYDLKEEKKPFWKDVLKGDLQKQYIKACEYVGQTGNPLYKKQELTARDSYRSGQEFYDKNDFNNAIIEFQKALFATEDNYLKADIYNFVGYSYLRIQEYQKSIFNFQKALEIRPGYGYANDNIGFAFIMSGDLETGKFYLNAAMQTDNNDDAYSYRNFALYHQKRKEYHLAEEYFQKAFNNIVIPVDLLEYFYANYLLELGHKERAIEYLNIAVKKGEPEAIVFLSSLNQ